MKTTQNPNLKVLKTKAKEMIKTKKIIKLFRSNLKVNKKMSWYLKVRSVFLNLLKMRLIKKLYFSLRIKTPLNLNKMGQMILKKQKN